MLNEYLHFVFTVAPSRPVCKVKGTAEYGHNINLTCVSEEGSPTPTYKWERYDFRDVIQAFPIKTTESKFCLSSTDQLHFLSRHAIV